MTHVAEFPKMLRHPEHRDAVPATQEAVVQNGGVKWIPVPAVPEHLPDVIVDTPETEQMWRAKGYGPAGRWDEGAFERAHTLPIEGYDPKEWPKWMDSGRVDADGKPIMIVVQDPNAIPPEVLDRQAREYPKHVKIGGVTHIAQNVDQERALVDGLGVGSDAVLPARSLVDAALVPLQGIFDAAGLKREIVGELAPMLKDMIREALAPATPAPSIRRRAARSGALKSPLTRETPVTSEASSEGEDRISAPSEEISRPKKKPSGAAYRKLRRQRAEEEMMRLKSSPKLAALS
jgi:hypothetical protein